MKELRLSQAEVARRSRGVIKQAYLSMVIKGLRPNPGGEFLTALAPILGWGVDTLLGGAKAPHPMPEGSVEALLERVRAPIRAEIIATIRRLGDKDPSTSLEWMARTAMAAEERENLARIPLAERLRRLADMVEDAERIGTGT